jgi:hypothetical protein
MTRSGLKAKGLEFNFQKVLRTLSVLHSVVTGLRNHSAVTHVDSFLGLMRQGRGTSHSPASSGEI